MLKLENVYKSFGKKEILHGPSLTVEKGQVVCIIGPSGSGKTTLLRCINCLEQADRGILTLDGKAFDFAKIKSSEIDTIRRQTAMVFQSYNLFINKTAEKNITEGLIKAQGKTKAEAKKIADELLEKMGLLDKATSYPYQLSGGQQQRIGIARAIALNPKVVLFDEPTSALDPESIGGILDIIENLAKSGQTMVIVTHEMNFARYIADKVVFMEEGIIVEQGSAEEIFEQPKEERTKTFFRRLDYTKRRA